MKNRVKYSDNFYSGIIKPNKIHPELIKLMSDAINYSPNEFIYLLDKAIKQAGPINGSSINDVQRYFISCLFKSNGQVLTEPVYFEPL